MKTVITYGTFDLFHQGHYNILKRAKEQGDYLIVGVTSESYDTDRGKLTVHDSLMKRIENVQKTGFADKIIVEEYLGQKVRDIITYNVDVLVVGSDWIGKFDHLRKYCDVVYLERTKNISSTQIREQMSDINKIGIISEDCDDAGCVNETKYVSGIHAENVYCPELETAMEFSKKYELNSYSNNLDEFFDSVGVVYIKTKLSERYRYIKAALEKKKHVICDFPFSSDIEKCHELKELAEENKVILLENIVTVYLRAFTQLQWMLQSNAIGNIMGLNAAISAEVFGSEKSFDELAIFPLYAAVKTLGVDYKQVEKTVLKNDDGEIVYGSFYLKYDNCTSYLEVAPKTRLRNKMTVIGEKGSLYVYDDWWNTGYYKIQMSSGKSPERYSFSFEGTGLRYLFRELMFMIGDGRTQCNRLFTEEADAIIRMLNS